MADSNTFPNKEQEDQNLKIKNKVDNILSNIDFESIDEKVKERLGNLDTTFKNVEEKLIEKGIVEPDLLSSEDRSYVNTLPFKDKDKSLRYLDIFKSNPEIVTEYLSTLKKHGSVKNAKEAGETNILLYPGKVKKFIENSENIPEDTAKKWDYYTSFGEKDYDIKLRTDKIGKNKQKEWLNSWVTKGSLGLTEAGYDSLREITKWGAMLVDAVGPERAESALDYIENNWPKADDYQYPNKLKPFAQDSFLQNMADELTQFGIDTFLGGRILKSFGFIAKKAMPGQTKKIVEKLSKQKAKKGKDGKELTDQFGNVKFASSIAQKAGFWGLPVKYGIGRSITGEAKQTTYSEGLSEIAKNYGLTSEPLIPKLDKETYDKMTNREKASYLLKRKLIHGAEGTALIAGLTKGFTLGGKVLWGTGKAIGKTVAGPLDTFVLNPIARIAASRKTGIPQLMKGISNGGGFIKDKVLRIPPLEKWGFFSTTQGPLSQRLMALADKNLLTPLRVRGPYTKETKQILMQGEQRVNKYKKDVGINIRRIDRAIYALMGKGFGNKMLTTSSVQEGKAYWENVVKYLRAEIPLSSLPQTLRAPTQEIQQLIAGLSKKIAPYVKDESIKKEIIDGVGKYLTTSYEIFQSSFKPDPKKMEAAVKYFKGLLKKTNPKATENELNRLASQKVDDIIKFGQEGSNPTSRLNAITKLVTPDGILKSKQVIPKVITDLMGKVNNPINIITDTVVKQAELLSHLHTHRSILREGLRSGWIVDDPAKFAMQGVQKEVAAGLVPIAKIARTSNIDIGKIYTAKKGGNYFTTPPIANAIASDALATDVLLQWAPYKAMLAAKTTAQLSKTVLSLMTQTRNFETAMFFSLMQGHVGSRASVLEAMKYTFGEVLGATGKVNPIALRRKLTEWSEVGVIDSSIVVKEVEAIIGDITKGVYANTDDLFKSLMKTPLFRGATEIYAASDNVWKAYGYEFTKSQLIPAIPIRGLTVTQANKLGYVVEKGRTVDYKWADLVSNQFREVFKMRWDPLNIDGSAKTYSQAIKEIAAKYIKDVYPNYNLVPSLVKNWRRLPLGNFIAFRSENIRNVFNTMAYSLREMGSSNPYLRQMGSRRMVGLYATMYGLQEGLSVATNALTNIDQDFLKKYQRWFSPWYDKNSTLFPLSKIDPETKKFWTLNWSREQPYEGLQDALEQVFSELKGDDSDEAIAKRFFNAFFYNIEENKPGGIYLTLEPFLTPSLFIEAIQDIMPATFTGGFGRSGKQTDGRIIYDIRNDSWGEIIAKSAAHLFSDINPTTFQNSGKIAKALEGDLTKAATKYNTVNELMKLFLGLGAKEENPKNSITFQVSDLSDRIGKTNRDFKVDASDPEKILSDPFLLPKEFNNYQENLYREMSRAYEFITFLKEDLKLTNAEIIKELRGRYGFGSNTIGLLLQGKFYPGNTPPLDITSMYPKMLKRIQNNPEYKDLKLTDIYDIKELINIRKKWQNAPLNLSSDELDYWFKTGKIKEKEPIKVIEPVSSLPLSITEKKLPDNKKTASLVKPNVASDTVPVSEETVKTAAIPNNVNAATGLTRIEDALLSNTEKAIKLNNRRRVT